LGALGWSTDSTFTVEYGGASFPSSLQGLSVLGGPLTLITLDSAGVCSESHEFTLDQPTELELYIEYTPALCFGDSAQAFAAGYGGTPNYILNWGGVSPMLLPEGLVSLHLEDAQGCTLDSSIVVEIPDPLSCGVVVTPEDLGYDGALELNPAGGTAPYDVLWNTGADSDTVLTGLSAGLYSWVLMDANGCLLLGLQDLLNVDVAENAPHSSGQLRYGPAGLWLEPGSPDWGVVQVDFFDVQGRRIYSTVVEDGGMTHWSWDVVPRQGVIWVHDNQGQTLFRSAY
jgi:hypothetical protein